MKRDLTVYVASAWWRDCDPSVSVIALSPEVARAQIEDAMREMVKDGDGEDDDVAWSGVHAWSLRQAFGGTFGRIHRDELKDDLRARGYAYPEVG